MRYALLVYSDQSSWEALSDEEKMERRAESMPGWQASFEADRQGRPEVARPRAGRGDEREDRPSPGRRDARDRRSIRRDEGADRRRVLPRRAGSRRGDPDRRADSDRAHGLDGDQTDRRGSTVDDGLPRGVGPCSLDPHSRPRRLRARRGRGAGRVRHCTRALAARGPASEPGGVDRHHRAEPRDRPHPTRAHVLAQGRAAGAARGAAGRGGRREHDPRRSPRARLHLLPPSARTRRADRAHAARSRRPDDAGDRARVPRRGTDDGAATRAREAKDPLGRNPVPGAPGSPPARPRRERARRSSTSSSTRATRRAAARSPCGAISATRRSGSPSSSPC